VRALLLALVVLLALPGCGSAEPGELPPAAAPDPAPPLAEAPAGRVVPVGPQPRGIVADAPTGRVAVALRDEVALLDAGTGAVVRRVPVPGLPGRLALAGQGGPLLVPAPGRLERLSLRTGARSARPVPGSPGIAVAAGAQTILADPGASTLATLAGQRRRVPLGPADLAPLARGRQVAVLSARERRIDVFDARTLARRGEATAGIGPVRFASDGKDRLYVTDARNDALLVYHRRPRFELTRRVELRGGPTGIAVDRVRGVIWVALTRTNQLVEMRGGARPGPLRYLPAVRQAESVAVDTGTGRVFVAGRADGVVQLVDSPRVTRTR